MLTLLPDRELVQDVWPITSFRSAGIFRPPLFPLPPTSSTIEPSSRVPSKQTYITQKVAQSTIEVPGAYPPTCNG